MEKASAKLDSLDKEELDEFRGSSASSSAAGNSKMLGKAQRKGKHDPRQVFMRDTSTETELAGGLEKPHLDSKKSLEKDKCLEKDKPLGKGQNEGEKGEACGSPWLAQHLGKG